MSERSLKLVARITGGSTPSPRASNWEGDTPFVTPPDLNGLDGAEITATARTVTESALSQTRMVPRGVLVSCRAPIGHVGTASGSVTFNQGCKSIEPEGGDLRFLAYVLVAKRSEMQALGRGTTFLEISGQQLGDLKVPWPPLPTQRRIADYLDRETAQIDAMAGALDGLVARLKERRSAVITHYVTGGHTQRRAATIPETQGSTFPATAEYLPTAQLRHYAEVNPPTTEFTLISPGDPVTFMSLDTVWPDGHADVGAEVTWTGQFHSYTPFRRGDVLLPKVSPTFSMGRATVAHTPHPVGLASSEVFVLRPRENADARFIAYAVRSSDFLAEGTASQQGVGGLRRVSSGWVGSYNFPQYDLDEQRRIADHLDAETAKIDAMIAKAGELRALLDERRSALITATVTGQHPVPEEP